MRRTCLPFIVIVLALAPGIAAGQVLDIVNPNEPLSAGPSPGSVAPAASLADGPRVVLYDNGPFVNSPGTGVGGTDESVLQTNLAMNTLGFGHQFSTGYSLADDFTVTDADGWQIDDITFFAYQSNSPTTSTISGLYVAIWDGPPDAGGAVIWGDQTTNRLLTTGWSNIYRVTDTTTGTSTERPVMENVATISTTLPQGTYWLQWSTDGSASYSGPWAPPITINGQTTTGNALQYTTAWAAALDSGTLTQQGFPFIINGDIAGPPPGAFYVIDESANELYTVNPLTGVSTPVGSTVEDPSLSGMAFDTSTGTFYVSDIELPTVEWGLGKLDELTGAIRIVGPHVNSNNIWSLAYDSLHNVLYGSDLTCAPSGGLAVVDRRTGESICIGAFGSGSDIGGLAYDSSTDILYGVTDTTLYFIDRGTGAATAVGPLGAPAGWAGLMGLEYHSDLDMLLLTTGSGDLFEVNRLTGAASLIGNMGITSASASAFVPEGFRAPAFRPFPGVLWDNGDTDRRNGFGNGFPPALGERWSVLDDFTVPPGDTWTLRHFRWHHIWNSGGTPPGDDVEILVRANDPNGGGTGIDGPGGVIATANVTFLAGTITDRVLVFRPLLSSFAEFDPIVLSAGKYWIEWAIHGDEVNYSASNQALIHGSEAWASWPDLGYPLNPISAAHGIPYDLAWALGEVHTGLFADTFNDGTSSAWSGSNP